MSLMCTITWKQDCRYLARGLWLSWPSSFVLCPLKIPSFHRIRMNLTLLAFPAHHWYAARSPGLCLLCWRPNDFRQTWWNFRVGKFLVFFCAGGKKTFSYMYLFPLCSSCSSSGLLECSLGSVIDWMEFCLWCSDMVRSFRLRFYCTKGIKNNNNFLDIKNILKCKTNDEKVCLTAMVAADAIMFKPGMKPATVLIF